MTRIASLATCVPLLIAPALQARTWWVAPSSPSPTRLGTEASPLVGVQTGLDSAASGDTVVLEEGTYSGNGYVNRGKTGILLGSRTIVDGSLSHAERTILDGSNTDTSGFGLRPSILALTLSDTAAFAIRGLTFRRGGSATGGAVQIVPATASSRAGASFADVRFEDNVAVRGGAVAGGTNVFRDCRFARNRALADPATGRSWEARGGAFAADSSLVATAGSRWLDCVLEGNSAVAGGAIHEWKAPLVRGGSFERNVASGQGGAILSRGTDTARIDGASFRENSAVKGGAIHAPRLQVSKSRFERNAADSGGAFFGAGSLARVDGSVFSANRASMAGGVAARSGISVSMSDFVGNHADRDGGVLVSSTLASWRCRFIGNEAGSRGGVARGGTVRFEESLLDANTSGQGGIAHGCAATFVHSTARGAATAAADLYQGTASVDGSILDLFVSGTSIVVRNSILRGTRSQSSIDTALSRNYRLDVDPRFMNPPAGDLRLLPTSPGVDGNDSTLDASSEPRCEGRTPRRDLGYFGNTDQATCPDEQLPVVSFDPKSMSRTLRLGEVLRDSTRFRNTGAGTLDPDSTLRISGSMRLLPTGPLVDGLWLRFLDTGSVPGTRTTSILARARAQGGDVGFRLSLSVLEQSIDSILGASWHFRTEPVGSVVFDTFRLVNRGSNPIRIDSALSASPFFVVITPLARTVLAPGAGMPVVVAFFANSTALVRSHLRVWSPNFARVDTGILLEGTAYPTGATPLPPVAAIESIQPRELDWGGSISALGNAWDADALGAGPPVAAWEWVVGSDTIRASGIASRSTADLPVGWNKVSLRVRDNEGTWSSVAIDSFRLRSLPPVVDSATASKGLVLRNDAPLVLSAFARDPDQAAVAGIGRKGIVRAAWRSDLEGLLDTGLTISVSPSRLRKGVHAVWAVVFDDDGDSAVSDTLRIPVQSSVGLAVIVAGATFGDFSYHQSNISPNANWIYQTLRSRGYSDEQVWYANRVGWQSLGDPFVDAKIVDETAITKDELRRRIVSLKPAVEAGTPLLVAFVGHGDAAEQDSGRFFLNDSQWVGPWDLNNWLAEFDRIDTSGRIVVVLDFGRSGAFQTALRTGFDRNRVVVTSSDASRPSFFARGRGFSQVFFAGIRKGRSLARSFEDARSWSELAAPGGSSANPLLNADMDAQFNTASDLARAGVAWIGGSQRTPDPEPVIDSGWIVPSDSGAAIVASLAGTASRAWIEYRTASSNPEDPPRVVAMAKASGGGNFWRVAWPAGMPVSDIQVHAANASGALAFPWAIDVPGPSAPGMRGRFGGARYDRPRGMLVLGRRIGAGETLSMDVLDVSGRIVGRAAATADATGWAEAAWKPGRAGFHIVRSRWQGGSDVSRVLVEEVR
mgnify:CR=1 FL=1